MGQPVKILIVDDEKLIRLNLRALLEDLGYRVAEAADGREGLDTFDREQPDLVLADLMMPVMDGLSMIDGLREKSPEIPVIVISGTGSVRDAVDSLRLGAWDYVLKPIADAEVLDIIIKRALEKAWLVRENCLYREHLEELVRERTEELRESEAFLNTLLDAIPIPVFYKDRNARYLGCNRAFETFFGATSERLIGKTVFDINPQDLAEIGHAKDNELFESGGVQQYESPVKNAHGLLRDVIFNKAVFTDSKGAVGGLVGAILDITDCKRVEEELRLSKERLEAMINAMPDLMFRIDRDGTIYEYHSSASELLYVQPEVFLGKRIPNILPAEASRIMMEALAEAVKKGSHRGAVYSLQIPSGVTWFELSIAAMGEPHHPATQFIVLVRDITERRKAEDERKLLEAQLHQAQKMEAIGQLAGGIAHDFNNILTAIIGYSEIILLRMEKDSPLRHFVEQVLASADRAAELTNSLLAFSRRQVLHTKPIDLCSVVRGLIKMLRRLLPEDIDFRTTVAKGNLIIMADKGQIEQVLMNLVTNAKDAMPRVGTLTIEISPVVMAERFVHAHGFGEPGNYACVSVTDTGHGMDEETRKMIFEPFFTTKEVGKGTGLGMAIIYGIIQQHNGCITVSSEMGKGTTFRIYLPIISEEIKEAHVTRGEESPPGGTETILLAEDDVTVRELHKMILKEAGYSVVEAVDGQDAIDKFMEHMAEVDIVVTDVIMPKIDGKSLYEEIRKILPDMKVLFMSGYTKDIIVARGILEDEFNYITKPVKSSELLKSVRDILDRNQF
jgi:two-component system cell cycle sensor histidine kinase/response regulator CckA